MTKAKEKIEIYDTTLRDGSQMQGISLSVQDKLRITELLDNLGVDYIEGGWPGANPKDIEYFEQAKKLNLKNSKLVAFGSTKRVNSPNCDEDIIIQGLLKANTQVVTIVAKTWDLHVKVALNTTLEKNLEIIRESIEYLKSKNKEVILDCEHFFDAYINNPDYSRQVLETAQQARADTVVLCDTNGGTLPQTICKIIRELQEEFSDLKLGIHAHNDCGLAIANSLLAVQAGAIQVQGTINGYGERCGNADLISVICNLELKMNRQALGDNNKLAQITSIAKSISDIANINLSTQQPFVGRSAFSHKGGLHASAIRKDSKTYEHIEPTIIGNTSRILISEQAGISNILDFMKSKNLDTNCPENKNIAQELLKEVKERENNGYQYEEAGASLELLLLKHLNKSQEYYKLKDFRISLGKDTEAEATIRITVNDEMLHTASLGDGPGHALDNALRKALSSYYPDELSQFRLTDFKVRVIDSQDGTAAQTKVNVQTTDHKGIKWNTVGVDRNIIQATFEAISESIEYGIYKHKNNSTELISRDSGDKQK